MQNGHKYWSVLLQQKLAMLFIMQSVNSTTMKILSSNIIFRMISLPIRPSALCFSMSDFTGSSDFWIHFSLQFLLYAYFLVRKRVLSLHSAKPPFSSSIWKTVFFGRSVFFNCLLKRSRTLRYILYFHSDLSF